MCVPVKMPFHTSHYPCWVFWPHHTNNSGYIPKGTTQTWESSCINTIWETVAVVVADKKIIFFVILVSFNAYFVLLEGDKLCFDV